MDQVNDPLDDELARALAVGPSPEFLARVRTRIAEEPATAPFGFRWMFGAAAVASATVVAVLMMRPQPASVAPSVPLLASRTLDGQLAVPSSGPPDHLRQGYGGPPKLYAKAEGGHYVRRSSGTRHLAYVVSGLSRTYTRTEPSVLFDTREVAALQHLITGVRDASVDLTPLGQSGARAPMELDPVEGIVIPLITIEPLTSSGQGERQ